ncbi:MAG: outer membrane beta-barrel protein [Bacteroidia bacterium]|nr:outer membrane beta-barrel protein [Bacteroidia bacterium]
MLVNRLFLMLFLFVANFAMAQVDSTDLDDDNEGDNDAIEWLKGDMNEDQEFGIRLGTNTSIMLGGELDNPRPMFGLNGAVYFRKKTSPKNAYQADLGVSIRGSNFNNPIGQYHKLVTYYLDLPLTWVRSINQNNTSQLITGLQFSHLLNSSIYINSESLAEIEKPKLAPLDVLVVLGTQFYGGFVGFQIVAKYGLLNINNGLVSGLNPAFKNKDIHNFALELNLLF